VGGDIYTAVAYYHQAIRLDHHKGGGITSVQTINVFIRYEFQPIGCSGWQQE